jgi:hypothetical protein
MPSRKLRMQDFESDSGKLSFRNARTFITQSYCYNEAAESAEQTGSGSPPYVGD